MKTIKEINDAAGDYKPGDLVLVSGQAGSGKSRYLLFEAVNAAIKGKKVLYLSSEIATAKSLKRIVCCYNSILHVGKEPIGIGIYANESNVGIHILAKQIDIKESFVEDLRTYVKKLSEEGKSPDAIFIDSIFTGFNFSKSYSEFLKETLLKLKDLAIETHTVVFAINQAIIKTFIDPIQVIKDIQEIPDFVFHVEKNGAYETQDTNFKVVVLKAEGKEKFLILKGYFDFKNINLKFLETSCGKDEVFKEFLNKFKEISFIISEPNKYSDYFLFGLADALGKNGKIAHIIPPGIELLNYLRVKTAASKGTKFFDYILINDFNSYVNRRYPYCGYTSVEKYKYLLETLKSFSRNNNVCIIINSNAQNFHMGALHNLERNTAHFIVGLKTTIPNVLQRMVKKEFNGVLTVLGDRGGQSGEKLFVKINKSNEFGLKILKRV